MLCFLVRFGWEFYLYRATRKLMQAESVWSDLRRDLRRHLRELPDSSKSKVESAKFHKPWESVEHYISLPKIWWNLIRNERKYYLCETKERLKSMHCLDCIWGLHWHQTHCARCQAKQKLMGQMVTGTSKDRARPAFPELSDSWWHREGFVDLFSSRLVSGWSILKPKNMSRVASWFDM